MVTLQHSKTVSKHSRAHLQYGLWLTRDGSGMTSRLGAGQIICIGRSSYSCIEALEIEHALFRDTAPAMITHLRLCREKCSVKLQVITGKHGGRKIKRKRNVRERRVYL